MKHILLGLTLLICSIGYGQYLPNTATPADGTNTYTVTIPTFGGVYTSKIAFIRFKIQNTGAATLNVSSPTPLGAVPLRKWDGSTWVALVSGDLKINNVYQVSYDNTGAFFRTEGPNLMPGGSVLPAAITDVDDSNVILTLSGNPTIAALNPVTFTMGWNGTLPFARFVNGSALSVTGRSANSSGVQASITGTLDQVLRIGAGPVLGFGQVATGGITDNAITNIKLRQSPGLSLMGRSANSTGTVGDITAGSDFQILRRSGTTIGFGSIDLSQPATIGLSLLPISNGGTNADNANDALNNLLPDQSGSPEFFFKTDGTNTSWAELPIAGNGLALVDNAYRLGDFTEDVNIEANGFAYNIGNVSTFSFIDGAGGGIGYTGGDVFVESVTDKVTLITPLSQLTMDNTAAVFTDSHSPARGLEYAADYDYTDLSLIPKNYVDTKFMGKQLPASPDAPEHGKSLRWDDANQIWEYYESSRGTFTIEVQATSSALGDDADYFAGSLPTTWSPTAEARKIYIRKNCVLTVAELYTQTSTAGSSNNWSMSVRVNNTTDYLIATVIAGTNERIWSNASMNIALTPGDYVEIWTHTPSWPTNPTNFIMGGYLLFEIQ